MQVVSRRPRIVLNAHHLRSFPSPIIILQTKVSVHCQESGELKATHFPAVTTITGPLNVHPKIETDAVLSPKRRKKLQKRLDTEHGYRAYCDHDVEVGTNACGHGVYAVRQFLPGEIVIAVEGQFIKTKGYPGSDYLMELTKKWSLEPSIPAVSSTTPARPTANWFSYLILKC